MEPVNIRLSKMKIQKIDEIASKNGITRSEVIRQALTIYLQLLENIGGFVDLRGTKISLDQIFTLKLRDLFIMRLKNGQIIVLANTSSGGIGSKPEDEVKLDGKVLGRLMTRTVLIKVLSSGALPIALIANLSVEFLPTGFKIFQGIREETHKIKAMELLEGHTEENIKTKQTGIGITALGITNEKELKTGKSLKNDLIVALGEPKVGYEVLNAKTIIEVEDVLKLSKKDFIHEIIPVGHEGIKEALKIMQNVGGYKIELKEGLETDIDMKKSAGPSTVILVTLEERDIEKLKKTISLSIKKPFQIMGRIL